MAAYRSLLGTDRPTALGNFLQPMAEGFAEGVDEDRIRRRNIADKLTAYRTLMPDQLKAYEQQKQIDQKYSPRSGYTPIPKGTRYLIGPGGQMLDLGVEQEQQNPLMGILGKKFDAPNPDYGIGEEATSSPVSPTKKISGDRALMVSLGIDPNEREAVPHISTKGEMSLSFQRTPNEPKPVGPHYVPKPDGSLWVVDTPGAEPRQLQPPLKSAQPLTEQALAAGAEGLDPSRMGEWTPEESQRVGSRLAKMRGEQTKERVGGGIDAKAERLQILGQIKTNEELAKRDPRVIQRDLDKIDRVQQITLKYAPEIEKARNLSRPMGETAQTQTRLYENTLRSLNQMRTEFSDEDLMRYAGIWNRGENYIAQVAGVDQKFQRFLVLNEHLRSTAFQYGGKQLTPFEAAVVFGFTPHGREIFKEQYLEKMDLLEERTHFELGRTKYLATTPKGEVVPAVPAGTEERQGAKNPQAAPKVATQAKHRLSGTRTAKPDGTYKLGDGTTVTVKGGVIQ